MSEISAATDALINLFRQEQAPSPRGKFLSRVFGIFSENIVEAWCADERAPYRNLGRPTLAGPSPLRGPTLDFLFECRSTGRRFVVEQKCEIEFSGYRYFSLTDPDQLRHHVKPAFAAFLAAARGEPTEALRWKTRNHTFEVDGAILIWGAVTAHGRETVMSETGLHDVIGLDRIISECADWRPATYCQLVSERRRWCAELFQFLDAQEISCAG